MHCKCFVEIQVEPSEKVKEFIKYKLNLGEDTEKDDMVEMRGQFDYFDERDRW